MKKATLVATAMVGFTLLGLGQPVLATVIDGEGTADVEIKGTVGKLDNTNPEEIIPEGTDEWVNVTLDTATAFHTTTASQHKMIDSADYQIANNSGRGVQITLSDIEGEPVLVDVLTINGMVNGNTPNPPIAVDLVTNSLPANLTQEAWMVLGNKDGKLNISSDTAGTYGKTASFNYSGSTIANLPAGIKDEATEETYKLTLKFTSINEDGTIG
ncbi:hypothetical protein I6N95_23135 [Vagococcus sp. BWB3-3]|uniref:WxL domain-containing protein n=1 Tax=Vagococcus allomyrinae TaxID=2794353 RepID=A0A940P9R2_9ENTE|nr:hypothetical protein [Vagococcus allomyrinae]MBP1043927.1 hypothetical protein [Vagococcus allomyrinae]